MVLSVIFKWACLCIFQHGIFSASLQTGRNEIWLAAQTLFRCEEAQMDTERQNKLSREFQVNVEANKIVLAGLTLTSVIAALIVFVAIVFTV